MKNPCSFRSCIARFAILFLSASLPGVCTPQTRTAPSTHALPMLRESAYYLTAGHGPAVILLHGYTQTSRMWKRRIRFLPSNLP